MSLMSALLLASTGLYLSAAHLARRQPDYRAQRHDLPPAVAAAAAASAASGADGDDAAAQLLPGPHSSSRRCTAADDGNGDTV